MIKFLVPITHLTKQWLLIPWPVSYLHHFNTGSTITTKIPTSYKSQNNYLFSSPRGQRISNCSILHSLNNSRLISFLFPIYHPLQTKSLGQIKLSITCIFSQLPRMCKSILNVGAYSISHSHLSKLLFSELKLSAWFKLRVTTK